MARREWNHNIQYDDAVLGSMPPMCRKALDVGCGEGKLTRGLALRCNAVVGIDCHAGFQGGVKDRAPGNMTFVCDDVMNHPFAEECFDFISAVASVHHLPLAAALERFRFLLEPNGTLTIVGLYRSGPLESVLRGAVVFFADILMRVWRQYVTMNAPMAEPRETLAEIRRIADVVLPGYRLQRRFFFRYILVWQKPVPQAGLASESPIA